MRFLVDENLPRSLTQLLRDLGHEAIHVVEAGLRGAPDEALGRLAAEQNRVLVTRDLGFPLPKLRPPPPGVILVRVPDAFTAFLITRLFHDFLQAAKLPELEGHITVVSPGRVRSRKLR